MTIRDVLTHDWGLYSPVIESAQTMSLPQINRIDKKYRVLRKLGKGVFGEVFLCQNAGQKIAVKLLNRDVNDQKRIQKFKREFLYLKKLDHPYIQQPLDFGFDSNLRRHYLASTYIHGENIDKVCQKLSPGFVEEIFVKILQALHYLHSYAGIGLKHNDIKPTNILITRNKDGSYHPYLIDFGLASFAPSPEQIVATFPKLNIDGRFSKADQRSDLYSLGVVWYLCLTGTNPFLDRQGSTATLKRHFSDNLPLSSSVKPIISKYMDIFLCKMCRCDPSQRYSTATEAIQTLRFLSRKPYGTVPENFKKLHLPNGEWLERDGSCKRLIEIWQNKPPLTTAVQITGKVGQKNISSKRKNFESERKQLQKKVLKSLLLRKFLEVTN